MTIIDITVAIKPNGLSSDDGVAFTFPYPGPYLDAQGNITVPANEQPTLQFHVDPNTPTISWKNAPNVGTFDVSFLLGYGTNGEDSLWIWDASQPKAKQWPPIFTKPALSSKSRTLATTDTNPAPAAFNYCLNVGVAIPTGKPLVFTLDPRIINRGRNASIPIFWIVTGGILLLAAALFAVRTFWGQ